MSNKNSSIAENLRRYREACALSQKQVADALNLERSTYTKYETGSSEPGLSTLVKIAAIFNVSPMDLLPDIDDQTHQVLGDICRADSPIYQLAKDERGLVALYRGLNKEQKRMLFNLIAEMTKNDG